MSDQSNEERFREKAADNGAETAASANDAPAAANDSGDYEVVVRLMKENEELKERALRLAAEMENLRRRTARDVHDARSYAIANFARDMLSVSDNLRRALEAVPQEARDSADASFKALIEGVDLTERAMLAALERHGVKKLFPEGEKFDPNFHQAMFEVPNADVPANTVVQVVQSGYSIGERVLRPALVGVAKGGPKPAAAEPVTKQTADEAPAEPGPVNEQAEKDA
jgi:molecular chaperone GrpE